MKGAGKGPVAALLLGLKDKGKVSDEGDDEAPDTERESDDEGDSEELAREAFGEAFDALKSGEREAFIEALMTGCMHAADC